jgi:hypothetical protein
MYDSQCRVCVTNLTPGSESNPPYAAVHASAKEVKLVTFDADGTLYADGKHFEEDNKMIDKIIQLMVGALHSC